MRIITCGVCGKRIEIHGRKNQKYCLGDCQKIALRKSSKEWHEKNPHSYQHGVKGDPDIRFVRAILYWYAEMLHGHIEPKSGNNYRVW